MVKRYILGTTGTTFTDYGQQTILIEDCIPVGSEVTVTAVYMSPGCTCESSEQTSCVIYAPDEDTATVEFSFRYDDKSIVIASMVGISFELNDGNWEWQPDYEIDGGNQNIPMSTSVDNWTMNSNIQNDSEDEQYYVRVICFAGSWYSLTYGSATGNWTAGDDGYYYYSDIISAGESTDEILTHIGNIPDDTKQFNVMLIAEATPVKYDSEGNPYADWGD